MLKKSKDFLLGPHFILILTATLLTWG